MNNELVPEDCLIYDSLENVGYEGFIPKTFIADLLILSKYKLLRQDVDLRSNTYINSVQTVVNLSNITKWINDVAYLLKRISQKYSLRIIERFAKHNVEFVLSDVDFSYNYVFDINQIDNDVKILLNITDNHVREIEKLPCDVIKVLTITNGLGSFLNTSKRIVSGNSQMESYGDIVKVHKHNFANPLFNYKFSIKSFDTDVDKVVTNKSNKIIVGYFFGAYRRHELVSLLLKLLGTIILNNFTEDIRIVVYSFYTDIYSKKELSSVAEIIKYFSEPKQLKLFSIDNTKSLETMITENPGDDVIFLPNIKGNCFINNKISGSNRVNIISVQESSYNLQYSNVCKKTGGIFLTL